MSTSRNRDQKRGKDAIGLLAFGSSGPWEVAIDETLSGPARYFAQIEGPSVYLYFEIPAVELVEKALAYLEVRGGVRTKPITGDGALNLGNNSDAQVSLVRDDEFEDRYFLVVEAQAGTVIRFTITDEDLAHIAKALRNALEDLEGDPD